VQLKVKGEKDVKGSDFKCPTQIKLANPEIHIATLTDKKTELEVEIRVEKGMGYVPKEQRKNPAAGAKKPEIGAIVLDAIFTPIKNVNFQIENMRVGDRTDFDKLSLEIETDGTISPEEAFFEACDILIKHFNVIFQGKPEIPEPKAEKITKKTTKAKKTSKKTKK
jgi:DNA-directed RNA polymerase subunit alpha